MASRLKGSTKKTKQSIITAVTVVNPLAFKEHPLSPTPTKGKQSIVNVGRPQRAKD